MEEKKEEEERTERERGWKDGCKRKCLLYLRHPLQHQLFVVSTESRKQPWLLLEKL